jgi:hypothetical protein
MAWIWLNPIEDDSWRAEFDDDSSLPILGSDYLSDSPMSIRSVLPVYRSGTSIEKFKSLHCPPFGTAPVVDAVWKSIISEFVPESRIQFISVKLISGEFETDKFSWAIPFDRVNCIDLQKSKFSSKIETQDTTLIFGVEQIRHLRNCMGSAHLARDTHDIGHLLVSDQLKNALSETGEDSMFYRPEDMPTLYS